MLRNEICEFFHQEDGVGVIEIVLILVVLIGLVINFQVPDYGTVKIIFLVK